jgi:hypothetical protein
VSFDIAAYSATTETAFLLRYLMGGPSGSRLIRQLDEKIHRLPGLAGLHLVSRAVEGFGVSPGTDRTTSGSGRQLGTLLHFPTFSR